MQRLSIARSLRLALTGLTLILAVVAALGVASLYSTRQSYDNTLIATSQLASAGSNLASAGAVEQEVDRDARGPTAASARQAAAGAYAAAAGRALDLARSDPRSEALVRALIAQRTGTQALGDANAIEARQTARQAAARSRTRSDSRRAVIAIIVAGVLALLGSLTLIGLLIRSMRQPLDDLVDATRRVSDGDLDHGVAPSGPQELRALGIAFNAMAERLRRLTQRLVEERARLENTVASLTEGLLVAEPGSRIVAANPRAAELLPELTLGVAAESPDSPLPSLDEARAAEVMIEHGGRTLAVTASLLGERTVRPEAGDDVWTLRGGETDRGSVWTIRDVSERARLERAKSEFVATASHELRSPLTSIKGFVELLANSPGDMSARQQEFVDIILRSTDRLVDLVNDLLDVARIEAGHVEVSRRAIDAGETLREVAELLGPRIEAKRQQLELELSPALPLAMADPGRLRQIVANLLTNAHLYTPEDGTIALKAEADGEWLRIVVADTGVGMGTEELEHAFERFYRGGDGRATSGTGLGLSIVKSLVDLHDGEIEVQSVTGAGTTFTIRIPVAPAGLGLAPSIDALRGRQLLVVDDELEIAQLIADQLSPFEVVCTIATGGEEALEQLRTGEFDAVTLDIKMPGMGGFDVLRAIRSEPALRGIPVVFVSVFSDHRDLAGEWVVSKPIDADELRDVLGAAVSSGRSRVLVVGREEVREPLERSLRELRLEYQWETTGAAAARVCGERRFEVALVDVGVRNPQAVLQALHLRGRRRRRAVILFAEPGVAAPPGIERLGLEVVPIAEAAAALVSALSADPVSDLAPAAEPDSWLSEPAEPDSWLPESGDPAR